jgi:hypothetical protein
VITLCHVEFLPWTLLVTILNLESTLEPCLSGARPLLPSELHLSLSQGSEGSFIVNCLNRAFHSALGLSMTLGRKGQVKAWGSPFMKLKKINFLMLLSKGKHRCISSSLGILLYNCHSIIIDLCIYIIGVEWNPRIHYTLCISPWSYCGGKSIINAMLSG